MDGGTYLLTLFNKQLEIQNLGLVSGLDCRRISGFKLCLKQEEKVNIRLAAMRQMV